jgi:hypothetical protein
MLVLESNENTFHPAQSGQAQDKRQWNPDAAI